MKKSDAMLLTAACSIAMSASLPVMGMYDTPPNTSYDNNPDRSRGARKFKKNKQRQKTADKSKRTNRRKQ